MAATICYMLGYTLSTLKYCHNDCLHGTKSTEPRQLHACFPVGTQRAKLCSQKLVHCGRAPTRHAAAMLQVEKEMLQVQTAKEVVHLRMMELKYYDDQIGSIQTVATLLAGFAFTGFLTMESSNLDMYSLELRKLSGDYLGRLLNNATDIELEATYTDTLNWGVLFQFGFHLLQALTVCLCLCKMLHVVMETLFARQLGTRLALRGPEGSITVATKNMSRSLTNATKHFVYGLQYFMLSVIFHSVRGMHPATSVLVALLIAKFWRLQWSLIEQLATRFELRDAVSTAFGPQDLSFSCGSGGLPPLSRTLSRARGQTSGPIPSLRGMPRSQRHANANARRGSVQEIKRVRAYRTPWLRSNGIATSAPQPTSPQSMARRPRDTATLLWAPSLPAHLT